MKTKIFRLFVSALALLAFCGIGESEEPQQPALGLTANLAHDYESFYYYVPAGLWPEKWHDTYENYKTGLPWVVMAFGETSEDSVDLKFKQKGTNVYQDLTDMDMGDGVIAADKKSIRVEVTKYRTFRTKGELGIEDADVMSKTYVVECYKKGTTEKLAEAEFGKPAAAPDFSESAAYLVTDSLSYVAYVPADYREKWSYAESKPWLPWVVVTYTNTNKVPFGIKINHNGAAAKFDNLSSGMKANIDSSEVFTVASNYIMFETGRDMGFTGDKYDETKDFSVELYLDNVKDTTLTAIKYVAPEPTKPAVPTFVKKNGTQADTIIVLMGAANDSLFVATGRDSISAVAAGFAKFLKNDTIAVNKDTVVVAYAMKGELVSDTVKYEYKKAVTPTKPAAPKFNPAAGAVFANTDVTVAKGDADSIFVAFGKTVADARVFTKYTADVTIKVVKDTVIRAYAVKSGLHSDTAKASYTIKAIVEVDDLAGLNALYETFNKNNIYTVKGEVTITAMDGRSIWVQDKACDKAAGHSMLLFGVNPTGAQVGSVLKGVRGNLKNYNGLLEMEKVVADSLKLTGATAAVVIDTVTIANIKNDETMKYQNAMMCIKDVEFANVQAGDTLSDMTGTQNGHSYDIFQGTDTIVFRSNKGADYIGMTIPTGKGTIVAYGGYFKGAYQVSPRNKADMAFTPAVVELDTVKAPTFSVEAGEVEEGTKVELKSATTGSTIYYTTDGTTPTDKSSEYKEAIVINKAMTIKAIAVKEGMVNSKISEAAYTIKVANEGNELAGVSVYPNPSKGEFYVTVPVNATVEVYAANGQRVSANAAVAGKNMVKVNNAGIYFVRVRANGQEAIRKVVVR